MPDIINVPGLKDGPGYASVEAEDGKVEVVAQATPTDQDRNTERTLSSESSNECINGKAKGKSDLAAQTQVVVEENNSTAGDNDAMLSTVIRGNHQLAGDHSALHDKSAAADLARQLVSKVDTAALQPETVKINDLGIEHDGFPLHKCEDLTDAPGKDGIAIATHVKKDSVIDTDDALVTIIYAAVPKQSLIIPDHGVHKKIEGHPSEDAPDAQSSNTQGAIQPSSPEKICGMTFSNGSVPPHLRAAYQPLVQPQYGLRLSRHSDLAPVLSHNQRNKHVEAPRFSRSHQPQFQFPSSRYESGDSEQVARLHAQVLSLKNVIEAERRDHANMRKSVEAQQQEKTNAAFSSLLGNLLRTQEEALSSKARAECTQRDLEHRLKKIEQLEMYLSEGQKQLFYQLYHQGIRPMSAVDREQIMYEAELEAKKKLADANGEMQMRSERVSLRESAQEIREQQYKVSIRAALEAEIRGGMQPVGNVDEIAELEYNRGYAVGKEAGRKVAAKPEQKESFIDGYAAYHRTQTALDNFRHGRIAHDSPELAFLFDAGHPDNFVARGMQMGRMNTHSQTVTAANSVARNGAANGANGGANGAVNGGARSTNGVLSGPVANGTAHQALATTNGIGQATSSNGVASNGQNGTHRDRPAAATPPTPEPRVQERARKLPPARLTFAAELRGTTPTHNGSYILANGSASPGPNPEMNNKTGQFADVGPNLLDL